MAGFKRESHTRSLLKGISWRLVALVDTLAIVLLVTWVFDKQPSISDAFKIAAWEFVLKFVVYYVHERIWEQFRGTTGLEKSRTLKKSISWRMVATVMTVLIAFFVMNDGHGAASTKAMVVATIEFFSKFVLYYVHERVWLRLPLGRIRRMLFGPLKGSTKK